jgi:starch phosphorylase
MKILVNGGLNLSELDGWWAEAYSPEVGWAIGDGREHDRDPAWDRAEAQTLYDILEQQVVPEFYNRDGDGIPRAWIARMRESMARLAPYYSANRTVRQYTDSHYVPAATAYCERARAGGKPGAEILGWQQTVAAHWNEVRFGALHVDTADGRHRFTVELSLGQIPPESVQVELYAEPLDGGEPVCQPMQRSGSVYSASVPSTRAAGEFTPRVRPWRAGLFLPLEMPEILWQR